ncbi:acyltransferase [Dyella sp. C9]|uniref:acyltransferase family protein n=1 Tax=Dyella sp. C9 TaxID=2202154 RepID=UPI000DEFDFE8|nr:acyltransferase [Dyella sp. C9]
MDRSNDFRIEWMDALRGVAALLVLVHHYFCLTCQGPLAGFFDLGVIGVVAFFCISGYVIPWSVLRAPTTVKKFVLARAFRLYPAYWLSLAIACAVTPVTAHVLLANVTMAQRFVGMPDVVGVYWTLQVELMFYALIAILIAFGKIYRPKVIGWTLAGACVLALTVSLPRALLDMKSPVAPVFGLVVMLTSFAFYLHKNGGFLTTGQMRHVVLGVFALLCGCFFLAYAKDWGYRETPLRFVISYAIGALIFSGFMKFNVSSSVLRWLGGISYPLYLIHVPVREAVSRAIPNELLAGMVSLLAVLLLSDVIHRTVELPAVKAGKAIASRLLPGSQYPASA